MHSFGWIKDAPDDRDHVLAAPVAVSDLPASVDLRESGHMPPVYDQGQLGSCTANGIAAAVDFDNHKQDGQWLTPSRLFIYYNERDLEGTVAEDSGAQIRDGVKVLNKYGVPPESEWPYDVSQFTVKPPDGCYTDGLKDRALAYKRVEQDANQLRSALAGGYPVVVGITVFQSLESPEVAKSGVAPLPDWWEQPVGGHCILLVGYDTAAGTWLLRNSWSDGWGQDGYFTLPLAYLTEQNLSSDFWAISRVGSI